MWNETTNETGSRICRCVLNNCINDCVEILRMDWNMSGDHNMNQTDSGWRKRQIALDIKAENARKLGLDYERNKTVIEMAREAGMVYREFENEFANANTDGVDLKTIEAFAELVRADEREACAKVCETHGVHPALNVWNGGPDWYKHGKDCATAIRAREQS